MAIKCYRVARSIVTTEYVTIYGATKNVANLRYEFAYFFYCHFARPFLDIFGKPVFSRFRHFFAKNKKKLCSQI